MVCGKSLSYTSDEVIAQCQKLLSNLQEQIATIQQGLINDEQELQYIANSLRMKG